MMKRDNRGRAVHYDNTITSCYKWVKEKGYILKVKLSNYFQPFYTVSVEWYVKEKRRYFYGDWNDLDDKLHFETEEEAWNWLNDVVDGKIDINKILDDYKANNERKRLEEEREIKEKSRNNALALKTKLDELGITYNDLCELYKIDNQISFEDRIDILGYKEE